MYQPGLGTDRQLAQIRYAELLEESAIKRADRKARVTQPKPAIRRLAIALAASTPVVIGIVWMLVAG